MIEYLKIVYSTCYEHIIYLCAYVSMYKKQKKCFKRECRDNPDLNIL